MLRRLIQYQQALRTVHGGLNQGLSMQQSLGLLLPNQPLATLHVALDRGIPLHTALVLPRGIPTLDAPIADPLRYIRQLDQHVTHRIDTLKQLGRRLIYPSVLFAGLLVNAVVMHTVVVPSLYTLGDPPTALSLYNRGVHALAAHRWDSLLGLGLVASLAGPWLCARIQHVWDRLNRDWHTATALTGIHMRVTQGLPIHSCLRHAGIPPDPSTRISDALAAAFQLSPVHRHRLAIGEQSGDWESHLAGIIHGLTASHQDRINRCIALIPALLLVIIGGYILVFFSILFQPLSQSIYHL